jgi:hypothetical protein
MQNFAAVVAYSFIYALDHSGICSSLKRKCKHKYVWMEALTGWNSYYDSDGMMIMKMMEGAEDLELSVASETRLGPGIHAHIDKQFLFCRSV